MIKVQIGESKTQKGYPKYRISTFGVIVLFSSPNTGMLIYKPDGEYSSLYVGQYKTNWQEDIFTDYNEPITTQND